MIFLVAPRYPVMLGLGGLAYTFGLRHAFDADHISAIDNTTRKLLQEGKRPLGVGFFFSLGHSTVVFLIALGLGFATQFVVTNVVSDRGQLKNVGGLIGTSVSGVFLILIGILNLVILVEIIRIFRRMRTGGYDRNSLEHELVAGGLLTRMFGRLFKLITSSWQMYPIGFLFGLGFDTASEVALLAISAGAAWPSAKACNISMPETPNTSLITPASLMLALCSNCRVRLRSATWLLTRAFR